MARIISIEFTPHIAVLSGLTITWTKSAHDLEKSPLPQLIWCNGSPWREANVWLVERAGMVKMRTVQTNASALLGYAKWLESSKTDWKNFPIRKSDRCLVRYRGALISARKDSSLASSTVSQRMRQVLSFYRWVKENKIISGETIMPNHKQRDVKYTNPNGFSRTISVHTSELNIPNRRGIGNSLEDGLLPVSNLHRKSILDFIRARGTEELFQMMALGFFTGLRIGTICDIKVDTLLNAIPDPNSPGLMWISVGPGASPSVATKFDVTGHVWVSQVQLTQLIHYAYSVRRLKRENLASEKNKNILFLTKYGNPFSHPMANKSGAINVQLHTLRKIQPEGEVLRGFHFHQSRCTFATELARVALETGDASLALGIVMQALLHRDEKTAIRYIKYVQSSEVRRSVANEFTERFLGLFPSGKDWDDL